jgi:hypothetical protein
MAKYRASWKAPQAGSAELYPGYDPTRRQQTYLQERPAIFLSGTLAGAAEYSLRHHSMDTDASVGTSDIN